MFKKITFTLMLLMSVAAIKAQQTLDAKEMIGITPVLPTEIKLPEDAQASLRVKLRQMVTQNGFGSLSGQFALTADMAVIDKQATSTAPAQFVVDVEVSFYIVNLTEMVTMDEMSLTLKGVNRLEHKAIIQAINQIKPNSTKVREFMSNGRSKILSYYNTRIPTLITKAKSLAERNDYSQALSVLAGVPEAVDQYPMVAQVMTDIYLKKIDHDAQVAIKEARGRIAIKEYEEAFEALMEVNPSSKYAAEAVSMFDGLKKAVEVRDSEKLALQMKVYEDQIELMKHNNERDMTIVKAARDIGMEQAKSGGSMMNNLNSWYLIHFR